MTVTSSLCITAKLLICVIFTKCILHVQSVNHILQKTRENENLVKLEQTDQIWQEYNSKTDNFDQEAVTITNISIYENLEINEIADNWQYIEYDKHEYLASTKEGVFYFCRFPDFINTINQSYTNCQHLTVSGEILLFQIVILPDVLKESAFFSNVLLIMNVQLCTNVELQWFSITKDRFHLLQSVPLPNRIQCMKYFSHKGQHKLLVKLEDRSNFPIENSHCMVYNIILVNELIHVLLVNQQTFPKVYDIQICFHPIETLIVLQHENDVGLYTYNDVNGQEIFRYFGNIAAMGLHNIICFKSGYVHYLAMSGPEAGIYIIHENEIEYDTKSGLFLNRIEEIVWVQNIHIETYRNESILLMQSKNGTVVALSWQPEGFEKTNLPKSCIDDIQLSKAVILPKFGLLYKNKFIQLQVRLTDFSSSVETVIDKMLKTKQKLEKLQEEQKALFADLRDDYVLSNATELWNTYEMYANQVSLQHMNYISPVKIGMRYLNLNELENYFHATEKELSRLELIIEEINKNLNNSLSTINTEQVTLLNLDISGNFVITGILNVSKLSFKKLNDIRKEDILNIYMNNNSSVIKGKKMFPSIKSDNLTIERFNGIPYDSFILCSKNTLKFDRLDVTKIRVLKAKKNMYFNSFLNTNWNDLMNKIVLKSKDAIIPGAVKIEGKVFVRHFNISKLNNLKYPEDYVYDAGRKQIEITGVKHFKKLNVGNISMLKTINGIPISDFVQMYGNQTLHHEIQFHNLIIEGYFQVDGEVTGKAGKKMRVEEQLTTLNNITSDTVFENLHVEGRVIIRNSTNGFKLEDLLLRSDKNITITGKKKFLHTTNIQKSVIIHSNKINGHDINEFFTLDTYQELPNLKHMLINASFENVKRGDLLKFKELLQINGNNSNDTPKCVEQKVRFNKRLIVDELFFYNLNGKINSTTFNKKLKRLVDRSYFENLITKRVTAPNDFFLYTLNGLNFEDFKQRRITKSDSQVLTGNYTIKTLQTSLNATHINNVPIKEIKFPDYDSDSDQDSILEKNVVFEHLNVTGRVKVSSINNHDLFNIAEMKSVIFEHDVFIKDLIVEGLVDGFNFSECISNAVLQSDINETVTGIKMLHSVTCHTLETDYLNEHHIETYVDPEKHQTLSHSVQVEGSLTVENNFEHSGQLNGVRFHNITNISLRNAEILLHGDYQFRKNISIRNIEVVGNIQGKKFPNFMENIVYRNSDVLLISGSKIFNKSVTFSENIFLFETFNDINLQQFYNRLVLIDRPISIAGKVVFQDDIVVEKELEIVENLKTNTIMRINTDLLINNAIYLNRKTFIPGIVKYDDVSFINEIFVKHLNGIDTKLLLLLNGDQTFSGTIKCKNVIVDNMLIHGFINNKYTLQELYENTLVSHLNQTVKGNITFYGKVYVHNNFYSRYLNNIDINDLIPLKMYNELTGKFIFTQPVTCLNALRLVKNLNGINFNKWRGFTISTNSPFRQIVYNNWTVHGNVSFNKNVAGNSFLNGLDIKQLTNKSAVFELQLKNVLSDKKKAEKDFCEKMDLLRRQIENGIYKFRTFEYFNVLNFEESVLSVHNFHVKNTAFLIINYESCRLNIYLLSERTLKLVTSESHFGQIIRWITLKVKHHIYFATLGIFACNRNSGNLWKLVNGKIHHISDLGNITDIKQLEGGAFLALSNGTLQKWSKENLFISPQYSVTTFKDSKFISTSSKILLTTSSSIYEFNHHYKNYTIIKNLPECKSILSLELGIFKQQYHLAYSEKHKQDNIHLCSEDLIEVKQMIATHKPQNFLIMYFDGNIENILIFTENNKAIKIFEYAGLQWFQPRETIAMEADKLFSLEIQMEPMVAKKHFLAVIRKNKLKILEAKMYGERLNLRNISLCV